MPIEFPTSPHRRQRLGKPEWARHCRCLHGPVVHQFECIMCGRLPHATIRVTWAEQARRAARAGNQSPVVVPDLARYPKVGRKSRPPELAGVAL